MWWQVLQVLSPIDTHTHPSHIHFLWLYNTFFRILYNGVASNPVEVRKKNEMLQNLIIKLFGLIFTTLDHIHSKIYMYIHCRCLHHAVYNYCIQIYVHMRKQILQVQSTCMMKLAISLICSVIIDIPFFHDHLILVIVLFLVKIIIFQQSRDLDFLGGINFCINM